jgi:hypothetical protein
MSAWNHLVDDMWEPLPEHLSGWDPNTSIRLRRTVTLDPQRLQDETRLGPDASVGLVVSWTSSTSTMRGATTPVDLQSTGATSLEVTLPGDRVGGVLTVRTCLVLLAAPERPAPGAAHLTGSVLVESLTTVALDDDATRFPVREIDFASTRLDPHASWHLETSTELTAPFLGIFVLLINTRDRELVTAVVKARPDRRQDALVDELEAGVAALLLELAAAMRADIAEGQPWPPGTVGDVLGNILRRVERDGPVLAGTDPRTLSRVRTRLAGAVRAIGEGRQLR